MEVMLLLWPHLKTFNCVKTNDCDLPEMQCYIYIRENAGSLKSHKSIFCVSINLSSDVTPYSCLSFQNWHSEFNFYKGPQSNSYDLVFWNVMSSSLVDKYQCFGGNCCLHLQCRRGLSYRTTRHHIPLGGNHTGENACLISWLSWGRYST
jgi:hypothetical protein